MRINPTERTPRALAAALALAAAAAAWPAAARADEPMRVVATLGHLAAHAREVGGDKVSVVSLTTGAQDPHFVQPTPSLMVHANQARVYIELGLDMELWSEHVLDGARNQQVRVGYPGHLYAATNIPVLERPAVITRAQGDVHPNGNPHIWLNPLNAALEAKNIAEAFARNDPANQAFYEERAKSYGDRIRRAYYGDALVDLLGAETLEKLQRNDALLEFLEKRKYKGEVLSGKVGGWLGKMWPHRGRRVVTFHRDFSYFAKAFDVEVMNTLEPKPGVAPSPGHLSALEEAAKTLKVDAVLVTPYQNTGLAEGFAQRIGAPSLVIQVDCGATESTQDYMGLMGTLVDSLAGAFAKGGGK
jgi:ABC-type Zn uptake system ZnuABC Zn-binding protein ZnuA